jgi:endonuclease-8
VPEGDTIFRAAATMRRALAGATVLDLESPLPRVANAARDRSLIGATIHDVRARGKFLLIQFSTGATLLTHLRMNGSWHLYRPGDRWRRPRRAMRIRIVTEGWEAVGFDIPVIEVHDAASLARSGHLARLGPDPLSTGFNPAAAIDNLRAAGGRSIEEALLDQRAIAGIGNVLKSEVLFLARTYPYASVSTLADDRLREIVELAARLLAENVIGVEGLTIARRFGGRNTTRSSQPGAALFVYGRAGRPCRRCGTPISMRRAGPHARLSYWCPQCQAPVTL